MFIRNKARFPNQKTSVDLQEFTDSHFGDKVNSKHNEVN